MPRFEPFVGVRYRSDAMAKVTAPPYDVLSVAERDQLLALHPHNVVRVDLPAPDGDGTDESYAAAARLFQRWQTEGVLAADPEPSLYPYRMTFRDEDGRSHHTLGVLGALGLEVPGEGDVLPHERTTPKARSDRLRLLQATRANLSPIWGLSLAAGLTKLIDVEEADPLGRWEDGEGVEHELWRVSGPAAIDAIVEAVSSAPVVVADGHHRYETCLAYGAADGAPSGADATLCLVVELDDEQLTVQPIHRLLAGLPDGFDVAEALGPWFEAGAPGPRPGAGAVDGLTAAGALGLVTAEGFRLLRPRLGTLDQTGELDSSRLDHALAGLPPHRVTFQHGVGRCEAAVDAGEAQAAVLLRPVSVPQIRAAAAARTRMPPKSTFFWPKPRTGTVFRLLE
ncbi:MAG: DUF1015 family protein [Acidimicrobiia bacterium]